MADSKGVTAKMEPKRIGYSSPLFFFERQGVGKMVRAGSEYELKLSVDEELSLSPLPTTSN